MAEDDDQQAAPQALIPSFELVVKPSRSYCGIELRVPVTFDRPVDVGTATAIHEGLRGVVAEAANDALDEVVQLVERSKAEAAAQNTVQPAAPTVDEAASNVQRELGGQEIPAGQQAETAAPAQQPSQTAVPATWLTGQKPNGAGPIEYPSSALVPTDTLKSLIADQIRQLGDDPDCFVIYDNRVGDRGLEAGGTNWGIAVAKPLNDTELKTKLGNKSAFLVDVSTDGPSVRRSKDYAAALEEGVTATPF